MFSIEKVLCRRSLSSNSAASHSIFISLMHLWMQGVNHVWYPAVCWPTTVVSSSRKHAFHSDIYVTISSVSNIQWYMCHQQFSFQQMMTCMAPTVQFLTHDDIYGTNSSVSYKWWHTWYQQAVSKTSCCFLWCSHLVECQYFSSSSSTASIESVTFRFESLNFPLI